MQQPSATSAMMPVRRPRPHAMPYRNGLWWCVVAVVALTIVGPYLSYKPAPFTGEGSPMRQVAYILIFGISLYCARAAREPQRLIFAVPISLALAIAWCWLSISWAINPEIAIRRLMLTTILIWTIFVSVGNAGYALSISGIRLVLAILVLINYAAVLGWPESGIHQFDEMGDTGLAGSWRGIMLQKNFAGAICAFTIMIFVLDGKRIPPLLRWSVVVGTAYFLVRTNSKTSMGILALSLFCSWLYNRYNPAYRAFLIPAVMILGVVLFALSQIYWSVLEEPFSTPAGFTGRVQIWPVLLEYAKDHWLLGSGYGSFWNIGLGAGPIFSYTKGWVTELGNGHSGYLDMLVQVGAPGLVLVVFGAIIWPLVRLLASHAAPRTSGGLILAMIIFAAGHNFTETSLLERDTTVQVFLMLAVAMIGPLTATARRPATDGFKLAPRG